MFRRILVSRNIHQCFAQSYKFSSWEKWEFGGMHTAHLKHENECQDQIDQLRTDSEIIQDINNLSKYFRKERIAKFYEVLNQRTRFHQFVFETPGNLNNVWACLRTLDSFGIQNTNIILPRKKSETKFTAAVGSAKWLTIKYFEDAESCVKSMKENGYRIISSDLNSPKAKPITEIDWNRKSAIVLGNEMNGISNLMRELSDDSFYIPMCGFAESFNLSVACAVTVSHLNFLNFLKNGSLSEEEKYELLNEWLTMDLKRQ